VHNTFAAVKAGIALRRRLEDSDFRHPHEQVSGAPLRAGASGGRCVSFGTPMSRCQEHPHEQVPVAAAAISLFASLSSVLELVLDVVQKNTKKEPDFWCRRN